MSNIVDAYPREGAVFRTKPLFQWDWGQIVRLHISDLPAAYKVEFSNSTRADAVSTVQTTDEVTVPAQFLESGNSVYAWVVVVDEARTTEYSLIIPVSARAKPTDLEPSPEEQTEIEQALSALNQAVKQTAADVEAAGGYAEGAEQSAKSAATASEKAIAAKEAAIAAKNMAETKASEAAASASNASTAAQNASASASQANTSAQNAASSASAAEIAKTAAQSAAQSVAGAMDTLEATIQADLQAAKESGEFDGKDGTTFTPTVLSEGVISWSNDGGLPNPQSQNIKGPVGATPNLTIGTVETLEPGADATAEITGTPENPVLNLGIPQGEKGEDADISNLASIIVNSASGDIASFSDGADNMPIKQLTVNVEPVQDLHGQDAPYPPGGGKNFCALNDFTTTKRGVTFAYVNGKLIINGTPESAGWFSIGERLTLPAGTYTVSYTVSGNNPAVKIGFDNFGGYIQFNATGTQQRTFTLSEETTGVFDLNTSQTTAYANTEALIQIEVGSSATAWTPYSNICPITGWMGAKVQGCGVNVWDEVTKPGTFDNSTGVYNPDRTDIICTNTPIKVTPSTSYYLAFPSGVMGGNVYFYDSNMSFLSVTFNNANKVVTMPSGCGYVNISFGSIYGPTYNNNISFNYPSTATDYEPYQGSTYDITFPTEAGTVYGGSLDVTNGVLTVDRAMVDLGTLTWRYETQTSLARPRFAASLMDGAPKSPYWAKNALTSIYKCGSSVGQHDVDFEFGIATASSSGNSTIYVTDSRYTDATTFKAAMSGVQLVYELATPIIYQLTPQEIRTLLGTNNIWADAGPVDVEYRADTKRYIDQKFAELQALILEH